MRKYFTEYQCVIMLKRCVERVAPEGKGRDHRDTTIMRVYASFYPLISSPIGVTSHTTPLPRRGVITEIPL